MNRATYNNKNEYHKKMVRKTNQTQKNFYCIVPFTESFKTSEPIALES